MYLFRVEHILTEREVQELITACGKLVEKYNTNKVTQTPLHVHVIVYNKCTIYSKSKLYVRCTIVVLK